MVGVCSGHVDVSERRLVPLHEVLGDLATTITTVHVQVGGRGIPAHQQLNVGHDLHLNVERWSGLAETRRVACRECLIAPHTSSAIVARVDAHVVHRASQKPGDVVVVRGRTLHLCESMGVAGARNVTKVLHGAPLDGVSIDECTTVVGRHVPRHLQHRRGQRHYKNVLHLARHRARHLRAGR